MKTWLSSVMLSLVAFLLSASAINHGLVDSGLPAGLGLTLDESFNIEQGVYVADAFAHHGPLLFSPSVGKEVFGSKKYFPDHPPLARFVLGVAHQAFAWLLPGSERSAFNVPSARLGSSFVFAMTVLLLSEFSRRRFGLMTAITAAVFLMLMPRVVGHSRIAAQETGTMLAWFAAIVPLLSWWTTLTPPTNRQALISGTLWGLLLLAKVQGLLLPPLIIAWALWHYRVQAVRPLAVWGFTGAVIFFVGWPWLWIDPFAHIVQYLDKTTDRPQIFVWYLGERIADKLVPWHYPFVISAVTLPVCVLLGLLSQTVVRRFERMEYLLAATVIWPLVVFAIPGTPVYDGSRLFLVIMPALALLAARGTILLCQAEGSAFARRGFRLTAAIVMLGTAMMAVPKVIGPFALCEYNAITGGPGGAFAVGLESDYWASGMNGDFWSQVPEHSSIYVAPVCHQFQLSDLQSMVPIIQQRNIRLLPFEYDPAKQRGLVLLIHRLADLPPYLRHKIPDGAEIVATAKHRGVILAQLIDTTDATWKREPNWPGDPLPDQQ